MAKKVGNFTVALERPVVFRGGGAIVGKMEKQGPLGDYFDHVVQDDLWGEKSWEKAESKMYYEAVRHAVKDAGLMAEEIDLLAGGDLLNQLISAGFAARETEFPFLGLYGACSTMAESLIIGSMAIEAGFAHHVACCVTSHFSTAERQFRTPLELGTQKTPTAQRTVTGAGASVLSVSGQGPRITGCTIGKVLDYGIKDAANMGAAMAPAAADTIYRHLSDTGRDPGYYDAIVTGDLGIFGQQLMLEQLREKGMDLRDVAWDCGIEIFSQDQDPHMGGSGCGCSATVLNAYLLRRLREGDLNRILFVATGALLSPLSTLQGESIPSIAHGVVIERGDG
ncbi:MAG: stage V sporulation protein AD [Clostridiales bacterium]|nr:stage V sporulation protein AD [Clostridiales bacterium]